MQIGQVSRSPGT